MPKIQRKTQKIFAGSADGDQLAVFATMKTGTPQYSNDIETLQSATYEQGWKDAILNDKAPYLEEMNGVQYGLSSQIAYLLQQGLACEYDVNTTYYKGSIVAVINNTDVTFYKSLTDNNLGNAVTDGANWVLDSISKIETYKTALENAINTLDSQVVKLTGDQRVAGIKIFSDGITIPNTGKIKVPNSDTPGTALRLADRGAGYIKFGDGTILQWGHEVMDNNKNVMAVSMPISFPQNQYRVVFGDAGANNNVLDVQKVYEYTSAKTFKVRSSGDGDSFNWLAIGR